MKKDSIEITLSLNIDGVLVKDEQHIYKVTKKATEFTLEDAGMILFMWNKIFSPSTAHIYDVLKDIEKKLPKKIMKPQMIFFKNTGYV